MATATNTRRWALVTDERRARIVSVERTPTGHVRVDEHASLENEQTEHQHSRPSPLASKNGHTHAANPDEDATLRRRFAKKLAEWAEKQAKTHDIESLSVFAPAKLLGDLRGEWSNTTPIDKQSEHKAEIAHLDTGKLSKHEAIKALLPPKNG